MSLFCSQMDVVMGAFATTKHTHTFTLTDANITKTYFPLSWSLSIDLRLMEGGGGGGGERREKDEAR